VSGNAATWKAHWWGTYFVNLGVAPAEFEGISITQDGKLKAATWVLTKAFQAKLEAAIARETIKEEVIASKVEDVAGVWEALLGGKKASMEFKEDGTYTITSKSNSVPGKFWFEGEKFYMKCPYGQGAYNVQIQHVSDNVTHLSFTLIEDEVSGRIQDLAEGMTRSEQ
jgi:hypothetical protein